MRTVDYVLVTSRGGSLRTLAKTEAVFFGTRQRLSQLITSQGIDVWYSHPVHGRGQAARGDAGFNSEF